MKEPLKNPVPIYVTNSFTQKKEELVPLNPGKITMYSCGPTVYGLIHIGNLRTAIVADMFFRVFRHLGYDVAYVRNYTDIDDKIIKRAQEEGTTSDQIAKKYTEEVEKDYAMAGMLEPTYKTKATEHIPEIISMIEKIIKNGHAYTVDHEVIFSIDSFEKYGELSGKKIEDLIAGARVEVSKKKKNPLDFTLWKPAKEGEPSWESPWGPGRPGWHIECSAMASKWLGDQIDVHHGATDLIFPHHENEVAQSESASHRSPFVKYWIHNAFLTLSKEKMSKSLGNVFQARDFLSRYGGEFARYMMLSVHYRSLIDFGEDTIQNTISSLYRIYEAKEKAIQLRDKKSLATELRSENLWGSFVAENEDAKKEIQKALANDFNSPEALSILFKQIREFNRILMEPGAKSTPGASLGAASLLELMEREIGKTLGVAQALPEKMMKDLNRIQGNRVSDDLLSPEKIEALIHERLEARKNKNFSRADEIRDELKQKGVILKDSATGTTWQYSGRSQS